jgi:hypothetical protein
MKTTLKTATAFALALPLAGCLGHSSVDNETIGQVKKVQSVNPWVLPDYHRVDISLGVIRNGVGSVSKDDMLLYVPKDDDYEVLKHAAETGEIVKVKYNVARFYWYGELETITHAEIVK